jgi:hypothetical protein
MPEIVHRWRPGLIAVATALCAVLPVSTLVAHLSHGPTSTRLSASAVESPALALRVPEVAVTLTARPDAAGSSPPAPAPTASSRGREEIAARRDADLAAWIKAGGLPAAPGLVPTAGPGAAGVPAVTGPVAGPTPDSGTSTPATSAHFVLSSFNVLGSSHTRGGARGMAPGTTRIRGVATLLARHRVDLVGFQELQSDQMRELLRVTGGAFATYPGPGASARSGENAVAWRTDTWQLVRPGSVSIPYFNGSPRPMPVVLLRHRATGVQVYLANFHNPADTSQYRHQQRWRDQATAAEITLANRLRSTGVPLLVTGDMNEREEYFCRMTAGAPMTAARGGSNGPSGCRAERPRAVDWIFGSTGVRFDGYAEDRSPLVDQTTDHPVIVSGVTVVSEAFPGATRTLP